VPIVIPLVDLHRHLEGAIRPSTVMELADRQPRLPAPGRADLVASPREGDLLRYLAKIDNATRLGRTADDWHRITAEAIADAYDDGLTAVELRFSPRFIETMTGVAAETVLEAVADAVSSSSVGVEVGLIGIILRDEGPDSAVTQMDLLVRHAASLVGVDLAGNEAGYPARLFVAAFAQAHDRGLPVTIHAGEAAGPASVWEALQHLRPARIGHGVRSVEDPRLLDHLAEQGVTLEVAITSNVQTGAAPSRVEHQIAALVEAGVRVAVCTDNPTVSGTRLSAELAVAADLLGRGPADRLRHQAEAARFRR
jgi:adenosine deaminase